MNCMVASSIPCKLSLCADREHACAGDSYVSSGVDVACPKTQRVFAIASPHELHGDSWPSSSTGTSSFCCNQQYSITAVTTSAGTIAERYAYSAYGEPTICDASGSVFASSAINNRYSYTGREWDATVGLHHFRGRWMSPSAGRFLSRDPIGYKGGENLYSYVAGRPFCWNDPTGLLQVREGFKDAHYSWIGWWANLKPIKEYVASNCADKCRCNVFNGKGIGKQIDDAADRAIAIILNLKFDPGRSPGVFVEPDDFNSTTYPSTLNYNGRAHSALRHCIWSALMANALVNCECSACVADTRDMFQYLYGDPPGHYQGVANTQQAIYNDREGRACAGCTGSYKNFTPHNNTHYILPALSEGQMVSCCTNKLLGKRLATNINTPGVLPQMPVRPAINVPPQNTPPTFPWPGVF